MLTKPWNACKTGPAAEDNREDEEVVNHTHARGEPFFRVDGFDEGFAIIGLQGGVQSRVQGCFLFLRRAT